MLDNFKTVLAFFKGQASVKQLAKAIIAILSAGSEFLPDDKFNQPADPNAVPLPAPLTDEAGALAFIENAVANESPDREAAFQLPPAVKAFLLQLLTKYLLGA